MPVVYDICLGAVFDHPKDSFWMEKQFKLMNHYSKKAYTAAWYAIQFKMHYYHSKEQGWLKKFDTMMRERDASLIETYKLSKKYEDNIYRADNDQTCECKPIQTAIKEDLVTLFGLSIIIENFMLFNNLRFDTMEVGTNNADPHGGDKSLYAPVVSVSITDKGFAIPYGTEARHGAPFLASLVSVNVGEVAVKDSLSGKPYSRSTFPDDKIIEHVSTFDAYSINHITQLKAIEAI